jgi:glycosyltransferase involved in cell wall biosynthesis
MSAVVSILIPAYNAQGSIADTIQSALAQTWPWKEIIVLNDGSSDQTLKIAQSFASEKVLVVTQQNQGAAAARNEAFSLCQGEYIQWLDADDVLSADKIARQMEMVERGCDRRTLLSSAWGYFMYRPRSADFKRTALWCDLSPTEWLIRKMGQNLFMQTATWLVSRELTVAAGLWNTRLLGDDDGEYFCRALLASDGVRFVPEGKVFYRVSSSARLSYIGRSSKKMEAHFESMRLHIKYLLSLENSARSRAACVTYLQNWLIDFYPERLDIVAEAERLAAQLGGRLEVPQLSWKYDWIRRLFGWDAAKRAQVVLRRSKASVLRSWDKRLYQLERRFASARVAIRRDTEASAAR